MEICLIGGKEMYCSKCGNQIEDNSKFCVYCGVDFRAFANGQNTAGVSSVQPFTNGQNTAGVSSVQPDTNQGYYDPNNMAAMKNNSVGGKGFPKISPKIWIIIGSSVISLILLIAIIVVAVSGSSYSGSEGIDEISDNSVVGTWRAVGYYEDGKLTSFEDAAETRHLSASDLEIVNNIFFVFKDNGAFLVKQGKDNFRGKWETFDNQLILEMGFDSPGVMDAIDGYLVIEPGWERDYNNMAFVEE